MKSSDVFKYPQKLNIKAKSKCIRRQRDHKRRVRLWHAQHVKLEKVHRHLDWSLRHLHKSVFHMRAFVKDALHNHLQRPLMTAKAFEKMTLERQLKEQEENTEVHVEDKYILSLNQLDDAMLERKKEWKQWVPEIPKTISYKKFFNLCTCEEEDNPCQAIQGESEWFSSEYGCDFGLTFQSLFKLDLGFHIPYFYKSDKGLEQNHILELRDVELEYDLAIF